jgi:hypothetical protein
LPKIRIRLVRFIKLAIKWQIMKNNQELNGCLANFLAPTGLPADGLS